MSLECANSYTSYNGHCYGFVDKSLQWAVARDRCKEVGTGYDLVVIDDKEENQFLKNQIETRFNGSEFWIGLIKEKNSKDALKWVDGSDLSHTDWMSDEPNEVMRMISTCDFIYILCILMYFNVN